MINVTFGNGVVFVGHQPDRATLVGYAGWRFPLSWSTAEEDWVDTKTGARFGDLLVEELLTHTGLRLEWGSDEDTVA